jgi:hypothetical protein
VCGYSASDGQPDSSIELYLCFPLSKSGMQAAAQLALDTAVNKAGAGLVAAARQAADLPDEELVEQVEALQGLVGGGGNGGAAGVSGGGPAGVVVAAAAGAGMHSQLCTCCLTLLACIRLPSIHPSIHPSVHFRAFLCLPIVSLPPVITCMCLPFAFLLQVLCRRALRSCGA